MKNILITGAAGGIGTEFIKLIINSPCNLILVDIDENSMKLLPNFKENGNIYKFVSNLSTIEECINITSKFSSISTLIHMAGILENDLDLISDTSKWDYVINSNLKSAYLISAAVMDNLDKHNSINFVFATSVAYRRGAYENICYSIAKSGIAGLTRSLAKRLGSRGVVNAICPGVILTKMPGEYINRHKDRLLQNIPMKRFGMPSEVAKLIKFLASNECSYITGQIINIDGGSVNS